MTINVNSTKTNKRPGMTVTDETIRACLLKLVRDRGPNKTICPSEVARALTGKHGQELMSRVRAVGVALASAGDISVMQKGQMVDPKIAKGPIRYRINPQSVDP